MDKPMAETEIEAEFTLESLANCPACRERVDTVQVVRILRTKVNFVSSLPRRGLVMICPKCQAILTGSLGGLV
jgi:hypothetical protein